MASVKPRNATPPSSSVTGSPFKTLFRVLAVLAVGVTLLTVSPVRCRLNDQEVDQREGKMHAAFVKEFAASSTEVSPETVQKEGGNAPSGAMLFAPQVILEVLALLREGAKGKTRDELNNFLGSPKVFEGKQKTLKALVDKLNNVEDAGVEFRYGSAIFVDQTVDGDETYKAYETRVQRKYAAVPQLADFANAPEAAAAKINKFVDEKTSGRISQLVDKSAITKDLKLVVASAMFFKGKWALPFEKKKTRPGNFTTIATESGKKTRVTVPHVQFMHREFEFWDSEGFSFRDNSEVTTMVLPYEAEGWSMAFVMPKDPLKFEAFESDPLAIKKHISEARSNEEWAIHGSDVLVSVPKFRIEAEVKEITPILSELGMSSMFSDTADFSEMSEQFRLKVSKFVTGAMIEVVEEGTTAAGVAGAMMMMMSMPPRQIVLAFNQPFIAAVLYTPPKAKSAEEITLFQLRITNPLPLQKEFKETW